MSVPAQLPNVTPTIGDAQRQHEISVVFVCAGGFSRSGEVQFDFNKYVAAHHPDLAFRTSHSGYFLNNFVENAASNDFVVPVLESFEPLVKYALLQHYNNYAEAARRVVWAGELHNVDSIERGRRFEKVVEIIRERTGRPKPRPASIPGPLELPSAGKGK